MNAEIQRFKEAVARVVALLQANEKLTLDEEDMIAAEIALSRDEEDTFLADLGITEPDRVPITDDDVHTL